jgi:putative transposase
VLAVKVMESTSMPEVRRSFEALFKNYGIPKAIQVDNGVPFINVQVRGGLTRLSAWWISLGIRVVRSQPGCP